MTEYALVLITCGQEEEARRIARALVEEKLAAGVQILPIESVYTWEDETVEDHELLLIAKTRADRFEEIKARVTELHSYEVPPLVLLQMEDATGPYLDWIDRAIT